MVPIPLELERTATIASLKVGKSLLENITNSPPSPTKTPQEIAERLGFASCDWATIQNITTREERNAELENEALNVMWRMLRRAEVKFSEKNEVVTGVNLNRGHFCVFIIVLNLMFALLAMLFYILRNKLF